MEFIFLRLARYQQVFNKPDVEEGSASPTAPPNSENLNGNNYPSELPPPYNPHYQDPHSVIVESPSGNFYITSENI